MDWGWGLREVRLVGRSSLVDGLFDAVAAGHQVNGGVGGGLLELWRQAGVGVGGQLVAAVAEQGLDRLTRSTRSSARYDAPTPTSQQPCSNATKPMPTATLAASAPAGRARAETFAPKGPVQQHGERLPRRQCGLGEAVTAASQPGDLQYPQVELKAAALVPLRSARPRDSADSYVPRPRPIPLGGARCLTTPRCRSLLRGEDHLPVLGQ